MLLFATTGITLNHAGDISAEPKTTKQTIKVEGTALAAIQHAVPEGAKQPLPASVQHIAKKRLGIDVAGKDGEWSEYEVFVALPRPGGDATLTIDRKSGETTYESTDRGWIAFFNDLHKGRNAGPAWGWFIDLFAVSCLTFTITGLLLLQLHARTRPSTWPLIGFGLLLPVLLILLLLHR